MFLPHNELQTDHFIMSSHKDVEVVFSFIHRLQAQAFILQKSVEITYL